MTITPLKAAADSTDIAPRAPLGPVGVGLGLGGAPSVVKDFFYQNW